MLPSAGDDRGEDDNWVEEDSSEEETDDNEVDGTDDDETKEEPKAKSWFSSQSTIGSFLQNISGKNELDEDDVTEILSKLREQVRRNEWNLLAPALAVDDR